MKKLLVEHEIPSYLLFKKSIVDFNKMKERNERLMLSNF